MVKRSFEDALRYGREGETRVMLRLQDAGVLVTPKADYITAIGRAPTQASSDEKLTPCDLDCAYLGVAFGLQIKRKAEPTLTRLYNRYDHGFEEAHYNMYLRWERECGIPLGICVTEDAGLNGQPGQNLYKLLREIRPRRGRNEEDRPMIYFHRDSLISQAEFLVQMAEMPIFARQRRLV